MLLQFIRRVSATVVISGALFINASALAASPKHAAGKPAHPATLSASLWKTVITKDTMTDKKTCFATYLPDKRVQIAPDEGIAVSMHGYGGVKIWRMRVNDEPIQNEGDFPGMYMSDDMFSVPSLTDRIADGGVTRVRAEVLTVLGELVMFDIDLKDGAKVMTNLKTACA